MIHPNVLRDVFDRAVSLSAEARNGFLARECGDNAELREQVERLLAAQHATVFESVNPSSDPSEASSLASDTVRLSLGEGVRLGPYQILTILGVGGMGEVYKARDMRLDRIVALKVLPRELTGNLAVRQRFEREARTVAALAHPHICTLLDVGQQEDVDYLVMEYLNGETLAVRLAQGKLPPGEALTYTSQIAEALDAAHQAGIVHRDLKPGNVMLTRAGAKLLDFGLAKRQQIVVSGELTTLQSQPVTRAGMILGTMPYMAPEQLEGREADARTDIWALGAILYEMLAGRRPFESDTAATLIGEILHATPPSLAKHQPLTPPALERLVRKCLAKHPRDRWDTAHDLADELRWIGQSLATPGDPATSLQHRHKLRMGLTGGAILVTALAGAGMAALLRSPPLPPSLVRVSLDVRPAEELNAGSSSVHQMTPGGSGTALTWTPAGKELVFVGRRAGVQQLYVRRLDGAEARPLPGTAGAHTPAVSLDGKWVAFWADGVIRKVPLEGGPVMDLASGVGAPPWGLVWTVHGTLLFGGRAEAIREVTAAGVVKAVTKVSDTETSHGLPWPLPGGLSLLFTARKRERSWGDEAVVVQDLPTGSRRILLHDAADARYLPPGYLVFLRRGMLVAVPFDAEQLKIRGPEVPLIDAVAQALTSGNSDDFTGAGQFAISGSGTLAWLSNPAVRYPDRVLVTVDQRGQVTALGAPVRSYSPALRVLGNGRLLTVPIDSLTERGLWLYDLERRLLTPMLRDGEVTWPLWWPDGRAVAFQWLKNGRYAVATYRADRSAAPHLMLTEVQPALAWDGPIVPSSITADGRHLAAVLQEHGREDIIIARLGEGKPRIARWLETRESEGWAEFSPDGRSLAYASDATGEFQVYVRPYPDPGPAYQLSVDGGSSPAWDRVGRTLFFLSPSKIPGTSQMMAATVQSRSPLRMSTPRRLFDFQRTDLLFQCAPARCFDLAPDGQRFYVTQAVRVPALPAVTHINLILNWFEELRAKVPGQ